MRQSTGVHWNQVQACIETIDRLLNREVPVRITVVDNGSRPEALEELRRAVQDRQSQVGLIEVGANAGFGPGANVGLREFLADPEDGEWVVLAPHDVDPFPGCLAAMLLEAQAQPMAGLMCADVGDGMIPVIDPYFGGMVVPATHVRSSAAHGGAAHWEDAAFPHGTLMMLKRDCLAEIGLFDERYFSYCEEADLALRARAAGWSIGLIRGARVQNIHIGSGLAVVDYLQTRNTLLLVQEMSGNYHAFIRAWFTIVQTLRGIQKPSTRPIIFDARARVMGLRDFVLRRFGPPPTSIASPPSQFDPSMHGGTNNANAG
ncbi:MAG: glycosyltransferase [Actinobacteria bacterium]|nr:glycosyltransferase [Actinomycetota bacterium]